MAVGQPPDRGSSSNPRILVSFPSSGGFRERRVVGGLVDDLEARFGGDSVLTSESVLAPAGAQGHRGSTNRPSAVERVISTCDAMLVTVGPGSLGPLTDHGGRFDELWLFEIEAALGHEVPVIPVLVDGARLPADERLPRSLRALALRQTVPLRLESWHTDMGRLADAIQDVVDRKTVSRPVLSTPVGSDEQLAEQDRFEVVDVLAVPGDGEVRRIELCFGDLAALPPEHAVDVLVLSALPDAYVPTPRSLIWRLEQKRGISVAALARRKAVDLRETCSCWMSEQISSDQDPGFRRILCFEPHYRGEPASVVGDIFRSLIPFLEGSLAVRTVAMPIVSTGLAGVPVSSMLPPLIEAAVKWMAVGLALERLKVVIYSHKQRSEAAAIFRSLKQTYGEASSPTPSAHVYDFFVSYAHRNAEDVERLEDELMALKSNLRIFRDRNDLVPGVPWQHELFTALEECRKVLVLYSPEYIKSKVCQEEFNIAWIRNRDSDEPVLIPIYLYSAELPVYMTLPQHYDCREGDIAKLRSTCERLISTIDE